MEKSLVIFSLYYRYCGFASKDQGTVHQDPTNAIENVIRVFSTPKSSQFPYELSININMLPFFQQFEEIQCMRLLAGAQFSPNNHFSSREHSIYLLLDVIMSLGDCAVMTRDMVSWGCNSRGRIRLSFKDSSCLIQLARILISLDQEMGNVCALLVHVVLNEIIFLTSDEHIYHRLIYHGVHWLGTREIRGDVTKGGYGLGKVFPNAAVCVNEMGRVTAHGWVQTYPIGELVPWIQCQVNPRYHMRPLGAFERVRDIKQRV